MITPGFKPAVDGPFDPSEIIDRHDDYVELRSPDKLWGYAPGFDLDKDVPWAFFEASLAKFPDKVCRFFMPPLLLHIKQTFLCDYLL